MEFLPCELKILIFNLCTFDTLYTLMTINSEFYNLIKLFILDKKRFNLLNKINNIESINNFINLIEWNVNDPIKNCVINYTSIFNEHNIEIQKSSKIEKITINQFDYLLHKPIYGIYNINVPFCDYNIDSPIIYGNEIYTCTITFTKQNPCTIYKIMVYLHNNKEHLQKWSYWGGALDGIYHGDLKLRLKYKQ